MSDILSEAASIVDGERQKEYGPPSENFARIASLWTAYLDGRGLIDLNKTDGITATDYALMQALVKIARLEHGYSHDSVVDLAGYAACAAQINEAEPTFITATCPFTPEDSVTCDSGATIKGRDVYCQRLHDHHGHHEQFNDDFSEATASWPNNG